MGIGVRLDKAWCRPSAEVRCRSAPLLLVRPGLVRLEVLQHRLVVLGVAPLGGVSALHVLVVPVDALLHVPGHVQPVLHDDVGVLRRGHPLLRTVVVGLLEEPHQEHDPVQVGQLGVQRRLQHVGHGHVGETALLVPPLLPVPGGLDLQDVLPLTVQLDVTVHHPAEDILVVEVVVAALLLGDGLLDGEFGAFGDVQGLSEHGVDPGPEVLPQDGLQDVPGVDVLVGLVPGVQAGELACHLERGGELAHAQDRCDPGPRDLLQPVCVEDDGALVLIDVDYACSAVECHIEDINNLHQKHIVVGGQSIRILCILWIDSSPLTFSTNES